MGVVTGAAASFNGGTITQPLTITTPASQTGLTISAADAAGKLIHATALHSYLDFDDDGSFTIRSDDGLSVALQGDGASSSLQITRLDDATHSVIMGTGTGVNVRGRSLIVLSTANDPIHTLTPTALGFFGAAAAAQPALTSGTATPEQIALALQSLGVAGGT